jgi:hypothetical protein
MQVDVLLAAYMDATEHGRGFGGELGIQVGTTHLATSRKVKLARVKT